MKPPLFEYHDPGSVDEALALLAEHGDTVVTLVGYNSNGVTKQMLTELARNITW